MAMVVYKEHIIHQIEHHQISNIVTSLDGATFIILRNGSYIAFGNNQYGGLGVGSKENMVSKKTEIKYHSIKIKQIFTGIASYHTFMLTQSNKLYGCGWNEFNQIFPLNFESESDIKIDSVYKWTKINHFPSYLTIKCISLSFRYSHFLCTNGQIFVCGSDPKKYGQLGLGPDRAISHGFERIKCNVRFKAIAVGKFHTLAIDENDFLYSWGYGGKGALGHANDAHIAYPKKICIDIDERRPFCVKQMDCGKHFNVVIEKWTNIVYCFGDNRDYECGNGLDMKYVYKPQRIFLPRDEKIIFDDIKCGKNYTIARDENGQYFAWGANECGQCLIDNALSKWIVIPTKLELLSEYENITDIVPGHDQTLVVTKDCIMCIKATQCHKKEINDDKKEKFEINQSKKMMMKNENKINKKRSFNVAITNNKLSSNKKRKMNVKKESISVSEIEKLQKMLEVEKEKNAKNEIKIDNLQKKLNKKDSIIRGKDVLMNKMKLCIASMRDRIINGGFEPHKSVYQSIKCNDGIERSKVVKQWRDEMTSPILISPHNGHYLSDLNKRKLHKFYDQNGTDQRLTHLNPITTHKNKRLRDIAQIFVISDEHHRVAALKGHRGVRATEYIPKHTIIGRYAGLEMTKNEWNKCFNYSNMEFIHCQYLYTVYLNVCGDEEEDERCFVIDPLEGGYKESLIIYINDCRKDIVDTKELTASDRKAKNCDFIFAQINGWPNVFVVTTKNIKKGTELLLDYGENYGSFVRQMIEWNAANQRKKEMLDKRIINGVIPLNERYIVDL